MGYLSKSIIHKQKSLAKPQGGVAMVEFVITLPFLLLMFGAVAEFGVMFYTQTNLNKAVNDASRYLGDGNTISGLVTVIEPQDRTNATNLAVYGNIWGNGQPLINGFDESMVTISCTYGSTAQANGTRCASHAAINSLTSITVSAVMQYTPVLGGMLEGLSGVDISIPLTAAAINPSV